MANLPPRPKSPPPTVDTRERDRGRDRGEPMASRLRDERGERPPPSRGPPRPSDTYIPTFKSRRDGNSRHEYEDRDRDRYRDLEWRDRHHRRERSPPPSFRRRESPQRDRDRRPPYRTATRRLPSPRRGPSFRSRSRSPRRGSPRKYRSRSRSRSHSPRRSPKSLRHRPSTSRSPRSHSPLKRRPSSGSRSPGYRPRPGRSEGDSQADITQKGLIPLVKEEEAEVHQPEKPAVKQEEHDTEIPSHGLAETHANAQSVHSPTHSFVKVELKTEPFESFAFHSAEQVDSISTTQPTNPEVSASAKMDFDSPRIPTQSSETDPRTPLEDLLGRHIPHGPRAARSPPRGPRLYNHPPATGPAQGDSSAPRAPKRRVHIFNRKDGPCLSVPDGEPIKLPDYRKPIDVLEMEKNVPLLRQSSQKLAAEIVQQLAQLPKMFYEYELAAREVRIAESRRKIYEAHLEKAKSGTLGMDYTEDDTETKT